MLFTWLWIEKNWIFAISSLSKPNHGSLSHFLSRYMRLLRHVEMFRRAVSFRYRLTCEKEHPIKFTMQYKGAFIPQKWQSHRNRSFPNRTINSRCFPCIYAFMNVCKIRALKNVNRVRALIESCVATNHRSLFVIVGDKGRHQAVNLHYILSKVGCNLGPSRDAALHDPSLTQQCFHNNRFSKALSCGQGKVFALCYRTCNMQFNVASLDSCSLHRPR